MRKVVARAGVILAVLSISIVGGLSANGPADGRVTFDRDVAPILYSHCVECHRKGEVAPMPLVSYSDARPWARSIKDKVQSRAMPPWLAAPEYGHFLNDRRLTQKEIDTVAAWVDQGAAEGDAKDLPAAPKFVEGWSIGKPDVVIEMPKEVQVPSDGVIPYMYVTVPTNFGEDKWVQAAEIRAGNRSVVHHIIVFVQDPPKNKAAGKEGQPEGRGEAVGTKLCGFAPGEQPKVYPEGSAKLIKAGSNLVFQLHYTTNGEAAADKSYVGLIFAKGAVHTAVQTGTATNATFVIPPGNSSFEVKSSWTAKENVRIVDLMPHMHVRGKDFTYTAVYPDGTSRVILSVPKYDFNWQLLYRPTEPVMLPKGGRLDCVAHFDNSTGNKYNPDPTKEVRWGPQTWEEMMIGWFDYVVDDDSAGARPSPGR